MEMNINNDTFKKNNIKTFNFTRAGAFRDNDLKLIVFENKSINNCLNCNLTTFPLSADQYDKKLRCIIICKSLAQKDISTLNQAYDEKSFDKISGDFLY